MRLKPPDVPEVVWGSRSAILALAPRLHLHCSTTHARYRFTSAEIARSYEIPVLKALYSLVPRPLRKRIDLRMRGGEGRHAYMFVEGSGNQTNGIHAWEFCIMSAWKTSVYD